MISFQIQKKLTHFNLDVDYYFESGVLAIQGRSGAGKTTVLNCISGLLKPDEGRICLNNHLVYDSEEKVNIPTRKRNIGYVFQNFALFPHLNVYENILYGLKSRKSNIDKEKIENILDTLKINQLIKKSTKSISGGEKQRVAIARVLVTDPEIMLLDEPFSALDQETKEDIYPIFERVKEKYKIPMILVSHNPLEGERLGDHRIYIEEGQIIREETII